MRTETHCENDDFEDDGLQEHERGDICVSVVPLGVHVRFRRKKQGSPCETFEAIMPPELAMNFGIAVMAAAQNGQFGEPPTIN